ncbi:MAG TPA: sulfide-dependent adenosine diphosphate thiazole synthase [Candidatus Cloacimonadota bacterium]|nr:sulfide-dependent adenosine diphosphate thiazole synthase [Candidatus Cloacimonadota bacterium]HPT71707.1 sulfide-dependent adenosine diphosphate thiazole synthase [Candidatus Cloacimonadota bacterium]
MEHLISSAIINHWFSKLNKHIISDVVIVGGGPSGLVCSAELAKKGFNVCLIERKLAPGGGMWGGAMLFNQIVVQKEALPILDLYGISHQHYQDDLYTSDSVEATSSLIYHATKAGVSIFNGISVEDVIVKNDRVCGVVINWTPVSLNKMHVDPLTISSKAVLDGTGHPCEVVSILTNKNHVSLLENQDGVAYEKSMNVVEGEKACVEFTGEVYPGLYVSGMAACGVSGSNRMGPIFGGMLLSGMKAARLIASNLEVTKP